MALLCTIDGKNRWLLYQATLLLLLLAINNRPTWLVVMVWHCRGDLVSWVFGNALVEDKTIGWYCHIAGQQQPGFSIRCSSQKMIYYQSTIHLINKINLNFNLFYLWFVVDTLSAQWQGKGLIVARDNIVSFADCCQQCPGTSQEWWQSSVQSPCPTCMDTIAVVIASAMNNIVCCVVQPCQRCFPQWQHKSLWPMLLLQWWLQTDQLHCRRYGAFAIMGCNWCNQFCCGHFGTFRIFKGHGSVTHCGEGLIVALDGVHGVGWDARIVAITKLGERVAITKLREQVAITKLEERVAIT